MANIIEIRVRAADETGPVYDKTKLDAAAAGRDSGAAYTSGFASHVRGAGAQDMAGSITTGLEDAIPQDTLGPASAEGERIRQNAKQTGEQAGKAAGEGMSPLLVSALAGGLSMGAPLILGAFGAVTVGMAALALKSNAVIAHDFAALGSTASAAITEAAAPLAGTMHQALMSLETDVRGLTPQLAGLFANAEPDITAVTGGVTAFATNVVPGMSSALKASQVDVAALGTGLGSLGSGVGGMFQGLTRDSYTTAAGMQSLLGTVGHLASTLGGVLGSAASVGSTALMGLDPVLNTTLSVVGKLASPGTVGALGGLFAAMKLGGETGALTTGLGSMGKGLGDFAKDAQESEGAMGTLKSAAGGLGSAFEKASSVAAGPWAMAIGAGVGLVTGLAGAIINASHASDALTLSQQGLDQAVAQDGGHIGAATAAYVAAQAQSDGLSKSAADAGVSLGTWTQAVIGNKAAQEDVILSVSSANQATQNQAATTANAAAQTGKFSGELKDAHGAVQDQAAATDRLTSQNQQLLASMRAETGQIAQAVQKQADLTEANNALANSTDIFGASLNAAYQQLVSSAQQASLNSTAAMNLGGASDALSQQIAGTETAYSLASAAAQGYNTALTALNGTTQGIDQAQNSLAQQMISAKTSFRQNKESLDLSTAAGVANRQALVQAASAIQALGTAEEQKTGSITDASAAMKAQEAAFVNATGATGKAKAALQQYIDQLLQIPKSETTTLVLDQVYTTSGGVVGDRTGGGYGAKASGGAYGGAAATGGARGNLVRVGERGEELVRMPFGSTVIPHSNVESMMATGNAGGGSFGAPIQLQLMSGGGSALEQMIWEWLRGRIKARGGAGPSSVQKALGQVT